MKTFFRIIAIAGLAYFAESFAPWWSVAVVCFLMGALLPSDTAWNAFFSGFFGIGILWTVFAWMINHETGAILTKKIAGLFHLSNPMAMVFLAGLVGALVGGFAALSGNYFRKLFEKKPAARYH